jgi:hypothetical protein
MRLDKTRPGVGQALRLYAHQCAVAFAVLSGLFEHVIRPLPPLHATAMLALTGGLFIISASEKQRD